MENKKKKYVYFNFAIGIGGSLRSAIILCEQLRKHNEVTVLDGYGGCRMYIKALNEKNIPVHVLLPEAEHSFVGYAHKPWKRFWRAVRQLPELLKLRRSLINKISEIDPDVIWTSDTKALLFLTTSFRLTKYPVVMFARGWYQRYQISAWKRWLIKHRANYILAVSEATSKALRSWGVSKRKIRVVFNAIDYDSVIKDSRKKVSGKMPGNDKEFKILVPGQLVRTKGQHTAIEAAALLKQQGYDFTIWIAGDMTIGNKSGYDEYLKNLVSENGLEDRVFFLGWRPDIPALMNLADIVVFPTHTEGLPRIILEAMILRRPVVSTPVGGVTALIIHGETGLLSPVDDPKGLSENIEKFILDKTLALKIVERAYEHVSGNFSFEKYLQSVKSAFQFVQKKS